MSTTGLLLVLVAMLLTTLSHVVGNAVLHLKLVTAMTTLLKPALSILSVSTHDERQFSKTPENANPAGNLSVAPRRERVLPKSPRARKRTPKPKGCTTAPGIVHVSPIAGTQCAVM